MDEKIEEMYQEFLCYKFKTEAEYFSYKGMCENFYQKGYRKEIDTAREILTLIKNGVELNSMIDGDAKIAIMNELRWAGQKYGVDFTNS